MSGEPQLPLLRSLAWAPGLVRSAEGAGLPHWRQGRAARLRLLRLLLGRDVIKSIRLWPFKSFEGERHTRVKGIVQPQTR